MKTRNIIITVLFTLFIGLMSLLTAILPKQEISVNEKRTLAAFPSFSLEKLFSGKWESDFESYISDHFPAREAFAATDAYFMLITGRNGSNGIYKGKDGYLFQTPVNVNEKNVADNISAVEIFAKQTGVDTKMIIVPSAGYSIGQYLPKNHRAYHDSEIISNVYSMSDRIDFIDVTDDLQSEGLYYKTDHHWTEDGAYIAYTKWCEKEGIEPRKKENYTIERTDGFYGTSYSKSALWLTEPDTIEIWQYPINVTVTIDGTDEYDSVFFKDNIKENDKYTVYLDGNHAFERITNHDNPEGKKVLLIKDSYAHCFAPFMAENCSQIDMVDLRYYFESVSALAEEQNYDEVLVLYGISNLCESNDLSILR